MKINSINFSFKCDQKWEEMSVINNNQRHCSQCSKNLINFETMTDEEVINYLINFSSNETCGKISNSKLLAINHKIDQTNKSGNLANGTNHRLNYFMLSVLTLIPFTPKYINAQIIPNDKSEFHQYKELEKIEKKDINKFHFEGKLKEESGDVILFASVSLMKNGIPFLNAETDIDGLFQFSFEWEQNTTYTLLVDYAGYESLAYNLQQNKAKDILIMKETGLLGEIFITGIVSPMSEPFEPKTWYQKLGNWFRKF